MRQVYYCPIKGEIYGREEILFRKDGNRLDGISTYRDLIPTTQGTLRPSAPTGSVRRLADPSQGHYFHQQIESPGGVKNSEFICQYAARPTDRNDVFWMLSVGRALSGYVGGDNSTHLADLMAHGTHQTIRLEKQASPPRTLLILEADTPYGHHKLWLDPAKNDVPYRIDVDRNPADRYEDQRLPSNALWQSTVIDHFQYTLHDGHFVPTHCVMVTRQIDLPGDVELWDETFDIGKMDWAPDFSRDKGAFHLDAPDGTKVFPPIPTALNYEWRGGKVVLSQVKDQ